MDIKTSIEYINSLPRFIEGGKPPVERTADLMHALGDPHEKLRHVHVTGTNGKGSISAMIAASLSDAGYVTGLFVSPFVYEFGERIQISGEKIKDEDAALYATRVREAAGDLPYVAFDFLFAMAELYFYDRGCDVVVCEVGIGGLHDSTNVIPPPLCSVVGRIDIDHAELLGGTLAAIAREKAGIIKYPSPAVIYPVQEKEAKDVLSEACLKRGVAPRVPDLSAVSDVTFDGGVSFTYKGERYKTGMRGVYQLYNAVTAIEALSALPSGFTVPVFAVRSGVFSAFMPARFETRDYDGVTVILDGAHNRNGVTALCESLAVLYPSGVCALCGMLRDKSPATALEPLEKSPVRRVITTEVRSYRRETAENVKTALPDVLRQSASAVADIRDAFIAATAEAKTRGLPLVVFGSLYLTGDVHRIMSEK